MVKRGFNYDFEGSNFSSEGSPFSLKSSTPSRSPSEDPTVQKHRAPRQPPMARDEAAPARVVRGFRKNANSNRFKPGMARPKRPDPEKEKGEAESKEAVRRKASKWNAEESKRKIKGSENRSRGTGNVRKPLKEEAKSEEEVKEGGEEEEFGERRKKVEEESESDSGSEVSVFENR